MRGSRRREVLFWSGLGLNGCRDKFRRTHGWVVPLWHGGQARRKLDRGVGIDHTADGLRGRALRRCGQSDRIAAFWTRSRGRAGGRAGAGESGAFQAGDLWLVSGCRRGSALTSRLHIHGNVRCKCSGPGGSCNRPHGPSCLTRIPAATIVSLRSVLYLRLMRFQEHRSISRHDRSRDSQDSASTRLSI
jgi:hypothetical protein